MEIGPRRELDLRRYATCRRRVSRPVRKTLVTHCWCLTGASSRTPEQFFDVPLHIIITGELEGAVHPPLFPVLGRSLL
jgi:hypothetical protein